jgi:GAF domain-containing protein
VHAAVFVVLFTVIIFFIRSAAAVREKLAEERTKRVELRLHAYTHLDRLVSEDLEHIKDPLPFKDFWCTFGTCLQSIQRVVEAAYQAFEAAYGQSVTSENRTDFEVTFMTKSYVDGEITIPASANRDARAPRSMILREKNPKIYENTVTASVYREERPVMHIIEDTKDPKVAYNELYPGETNRIRSSIIFPVLSNSNELLGTLVVHCDQPRFFQKGDEKYWSDLLEVFSKRIALVKKRLDVLFEIRKKQENLIVTLPDSSF